MRDPLYAGTFYAKTKGELARQIQATFQQGPGSEPLFSRKGHVYGVLVPHGGYAFSGPCAAWAYKELAEAERPDIIVVLGSNHHSEKTALSQEEWITPFGRLPVAQGTIERLISLGIPVDEAVHKDHSIEVQLPFLQYICQQVVPPIVCLSVGTSIPLQRLVEILQRGTEGKSVWWVVSSDLTHYGKEFGYVPFIYNVKESLMEMDNTALDLIRQMDGRHFLGYVERIQTTICGAMAIATVLELLKNDAQAKVMHHQLSGDTTKDYSHSVGYGSVVFRE